MITSVKEVMDFVYGSYFRREEIKNFIPPSDGSHHSDDRNNRKPEITSEMLRVLGRPDIKSKNVLVTGSKGKGSVSRLLELILRKHGLSTGLFTSPHLHVYNERIRVNGEMISDEDLIDAANAVEPVSAGQERLLKSGEYISPMGNGLAMALIHFDYAQTDINILECGRGARFDDVATAKSDYAVINVIFDEHLPYLGQSVEDVAWHKAGVLNQGQKAVFSAPQEFAVKEILETEAVKAGVRFVEAARSHADIDPLVGQSYNKANARLAYTAAQGILQDDFSHEKTIEAILEYPFSGCLEKVSKSPAVYMDGCIHAVCAKEIADSMNTAHEIRCVVGIPDNKAYQDVVKTLSGVSDVILLSEPSECHLPFSGEQADFAIELRASGANVHYEADLSKAIETALADLPDKGEVYIIGTQIYLGQAKAILGHRGLI